MHFDNGKFGAVVIVLALIGTIVLGYCTDVTKVEGVRTDYDYITDITGLFETEQVPEYIEYNPNSNYVGYTGPVVYDVSSQPNNYRFVQEEGTTTEYSLTVNSSSNYPQNSGFLPSDVGTTAFINYTGSQFNLGSAVSGMNGLSYNVGVTLNRVTTLDHIIDSVPNFATYSTVNVDLSYSVAPVFIMKKAFSFYDVQRGDGQTQYVYHTTVSDSEIPTRLSINVSTEVVTAYRGNTQIWTSVADGVKVIYGYSARTGGTFSPASPSVVMDFDLTTSPTYGYADPTGGVTLSAPLPLAEWDNGYENQTITLLVGRNTSVSSDQSLVISFDSEPYNLNLFIRFLSNGTLETDVGYLDGTTSISETQTYGKWQGLEIVFDRQDVTLTATPSGTIRDYTTEPSILGDEYVLFDMDTPITDTEYGFSATTLTEGTPYFGVLSTVVNLNSYNVVMNNPSIDIRDYWPNLDDYRLNFYSFALVGESITINGVEYPVGDGQTITVTESVSEGETAETYTQVLSNIYVSTDTVDGVRHTYLTFVDDRLTVDLGETVAEVVSFSGLWYFTTALYDAEQVPYSEYEWNLDGKFGLSYDVVFLIFICLCIVGIVLGKTFLPDSMHFLDYVLIIGAIVIAFACMEVFI